MSNVGYVVEGVVLASKPLGEKDRLITLMTSNRGLVRVSARGGRSTGSKLAALVLPFSRVELQLWRGRSLDGIRGGEVLDSHRPLREDPERIAHAYCVAEIAASLAQEGESDRPLYLLVATTLTLIARANPDLALAFYCVRAVGVAGFFPLVENCANCGRDADGGFLSFGAGELTCTECPRRPGAGAEVSADLVHTILQLRDVHPRELPRWEVDPGQLRRVRELMLDYLEYHLGRAVNSRRFIDILA